MPNSMTAYGRASSDTSFGHLVIEIQSVNRKFLELNIQLPKELSRFETDIRGWLNRVLHRGQVTVRISATYTSRAPVKVVPNIPLARELKKAWDKISDALGVNGASNFHLEMLAHESELFSYEEAIEDEAIYRSALEETLSAALKPFIAMREREGQSLSADMAQRFERVRKLLDEIAVKSADSPSRYRDKLLAVMAQVSKGTFENEERILREVALYADRVDIAEELTRARSHLDQFDALLRSQGESIGKTLEFLLQELFREVNTIASKSVELTVSHAVVDVKSEIERIREQVQNIE